MHSFICSSLEIKCILYQNMRISNRAVSTHRLVKIPKTLLTKHTNIQSNTRFKKKNRTAHFVKSMCL